MLSSGDEIELTIDKPAAGGRMLARHDGQVVFVQGAIPGERVRARVGKVERQLAFASASEIVEASADRRDPPSDPSCGGCSYAHIAYARQLALKSDIIHDAFTRVARHRLETPVSVQPSPERGYRMRARFHVRSGRIGFYREGTHDICDAASTGQLPDESVRAVAAAVTAALRVGPVVSIEFSENIAATERVVHIERAPDTDIHPRMLEEAMRAGALTGCSAVSSGKTSTAGIPVVSDPLSVLTSSRVTSGTLERHAESFFQANRFLLPQLVGSVLDVVPRDDRVVDLYAGVGLFSVCMARAGWQRITAVEGDKTSARDLMANASQCGASLRVVVDSVERYLRGNQGDADTILVDPPRTGISKVAMEAVVERRARRVVYVSCDPPTMARDAGRLMQGGYELVSLRAFDLFPNTPHVESLGVFARA
jgi:23S rRNA (uracil1939-C5)-methyltransferase